jgi:polysaccharide pyruvyl transferase WcaK-like protein
MHPTTIKYHSGRNHVTAARQTEWTLGFVNACLAQGWTLRLFTNGGSEDQSYLNSLKPALTTLSSAGRVGVEPRFATPGELARFIANLDLLYAHRLHANIAAYSYAVPHIGFSWDAKLKSFLARIGRAECLMTLGVDTIEQAVQLGRRQLQVGVDRSQRQAVIRQAHKDVSRLVDKMQTQL